MKTDFIDGGKISDVTIDNLIDFWDNNQYLRKVNGEFSDGVDKSVKNSVDMAIPSFLNEKAVRLFLGELQICLDEYLTKFPYARMASLELNEPFNIQWYPKGDGGYHRPHCERIGSNKITTWRHLAWMTYLNDVEEGGETYWVHQDKKVKPKKGLTLFWPADWTHVHHGLPAPNEEKMIATGWISYA